MSFAFIIERRDVCPIPFQTLCSLHLSMNEQCFFFVRREPEFHPFRQYSILIKRLLLCRLTLKSNIFSLPHTTFLLLYLCVVQNKYHILFHQANSHIFFIFLFISSSQPFFIMSFPGVNILPKNNSAFQPGLELDQVLAMNLQENEF